jgi:peptidoglycan/LPS O-acetylase OafA/YrhL
VTERPCLHLSTHRTPSSSTHRTHRSTHGTHSYVAALDGVRALAIAAVIAYHADLGAFPGGFLGVETFFVLSGFLVSSGLVTQLERRGRIDFGRYAVRRVQRLAPALVAMLVAIALVVLVRFPDQLTHARRGAIGALTGSGNWLELTNGDYFATFGRGPVFRHLWSFAVEVQIYAILPPLVGLLWALSGRSRNRLALSLGLLAVIGYVWQALVALRYPGSSRAYFGTDARIGAALLGASIAAVDRERLRSEIPRAASDMLTGVALIALGALVVVTDGTDPMLYRGVLGLTGLLSALLVFATATATDSSVSRVLGSRPLRWIGTRSYGLYLWHWPIFVLTRPIAGVAMEAIPFLLRVGATAIAAELSFRFVESRAMQPTPGRSRSLRWAPEIAVAALGGFLAIGVASASPAQSDGPGDQPPPTQPPSVIEVVTTRTIATVTSATTTVPAMAPTIPPDAANPVWTASPPSTSTSLPMSPPTPTPLPMGLVGDDVTLIGDSVLRAAEPALRARLGLNANIDSAVGRQFIEARERVRVLRSVGRLKPVVVIALGTNGPFREADVDALLTELGDRRTVAFVQVEVPRRWKKTVNERLAAAKLKHPEIVVIDWPNRVGVLKLRLPDGVHPAPKAAASYADLLIESLGTAIARTPPTTVAS